MPTTGAMSRGTIAAALIALGLATGLAGCGEGGGRTSGSGSGAHGQRDTTATARPAERTDTVAIEGMAEPMRLRLFHSGDDFPLPFSAYVPADMAAEKSGEADGSASVHFYAEFGGQRNEDAFVHVFVFPPGTEEADAVAAARGYETGRGVPVSRGREPIPDSARTASMPWALDGYRFRYQDGGGGWYVGSIGVGRHAGRFFQIVRHYPAEYGDGFGPRAALILDTWRWADDGGLHQAGARQPSRGSAGSGSPGR